GVAFLSPDEVPAILQRGERVLLLSETQRYGRERAVAAPVVNVTIQTPSPASFQARRTQVAAGLARAVRLGTRGLSRSQAKWKPVRVKRTRGENQNAAAFSRLRVSTLRGARGERRADVCDQRRDAR